MAHQIAEKDKTALEQSEDEQVAIGVRLGNCGAELGDPRLDNIGIEHNAAHRAPVEARIGVNGLHSRCVARCRISRAHIDTRSSPASPAGEAPQLSGRVPEHTTAPRLR